jgi:hypothetical protein
MSDERALPKPRCRLIGGDGNVFHVIGRVRAALRNAGQTERARDFTERAFAAKSYDEVLAMLHEYVDGDEQEEDDALRTG